MSQVFYSTKKFKKLKAQWDRKLEASGFEDLERRGPYSISHDKNIHEHIHFRPGVSEATTAYFSWACGMLHQGSFKSTRHKRIWRLHCAGLTNAEIGREVGLSRWWVADLLDKISLYLKLQPKRKDNDSKTPSLR